MHRHDNISETIGNTPLVRLNRLAPAHVNVFMKLEAFNPMGSVKDRMALAMIEAAEASGELQAGQTVIEATSGNTGIGLAMVCAQKGYPLVVTMAENFSIERRKLLRFLGAQVVLTPASEKGTGMLAKAEELAAEHGFYFCRQFDNPANAEVHTRTTAREIADAFADDTLHYWVSGFGTGGTLQGVARGLKQADSNTRIIAAEPDNAQVLGSGIAQPRDAGGRPTGSHPSFRPHLMQGWSPDFVARLTEQAVAEQLVDEVVPVAGNTALALSRALACQEGIFAGTSTGATLAAALHIAERAAPGSNIVCMAPDTGERYLSTPLFEQIDEEMSAAERALSRSTPGYRFDRATPTLVVHQPEDSTAAAARFVNERINDQPVVMFALEWCEFCWSARRFMERIGLGYESVDLDSVAYQKHDLGGQIRRDLFRRTGSPTIPQIYVAGEHIGGCTELFDAFRDGSLQQQLNAGGVAFDASVEIDPYSMLPGWLEPRRSA